MFQTHSIFASNDYHDSYGGYSQCKLNYINKKINRTYLLSNPFQQHAFQQFGGFTWTSARSNCVTNIFLFIQLQIDHIQAYTRYKDTMSKVTMLYYLTYSSQLGFCSLGYKYSFFMILIGTLQCLIKGCDKEKDIY